MLGRVAPGLKDYYPVVPLNAPIRAQMDLDDDKAAPLWRAVAECGLRAGPAVHATCRCPRAQRYPVTAQDLIQEGGLFRSSSLEIACSAFTNAGVLPASA